LAVESKVENITAYKFKISLKFIQGKKYYNIRQDFIKYIVIESMYFRKMMPIIYISMVVSAELYQEIYDSQNMRLEGEKTKSKFVLKIERINKLSQAALFETSIKDEFDFIISRENPNYEKELEKADLVGDASQRVINVALLSSSLLNAIRAERDVNNSIVVSGIFSNIDMNTLIAKVYEGIEKYKLKTVIKGPVHNTEFKKNKLIIPPMNSRKQILKFLFDKAPFYDTDFTFFIDFGRSYLLDRTKNGVKVKDNTYHDVIFEVYDYVNTNAYKEGITIKNNSYIIYVNPSDVAITPNRGQDKVANTVITVTDRGTLDAANIDINNYTYNDPKYVFNRGVNATLVKNNSESNSVTFSISKANIDASIFSPNKRYRIKNYGEYKKYDGFYVLQTKKEVIYNNATEFSARTEFIFQKLGKIKDIGYTNEFGEVEHGNGKTSESNFTNAMSGVNISSNYNTVSYASQSITPQEQSVAANPYNPIDPSTMIPVTSTNNGSGTGLGSNSIQEYKEGKLKGSKLSTEPIALGSSPELSIEEQIKIVENNRVERKHGDEIDDSSYGPVKVYKNNENITLSKRINI